MKSITAAGEALNLIYVFCNIFSLFGCLLLLSSRKNYYYVTKNIVACSPTEFLVCRCVSMDFAWILQANLSESNTENRYHIHQKERHH